MRVSAEWRRTMLSDSDQSWAYWAIVGALLLAWAVVVL